GPAADEGGWPPGDPARAAGGDARGPAWTDGPRARGTGAPFGGLAGQGNIPQALHFGTNRASSCLVGLVQDRRNLPYRGGPAGGRYGHRRFNLGSALGNVGSPPAKAGISPDQKPAPVFLRLLA